MRLTRCFAPLVLLGLLGGCASRPQAQRPLVEVPGALPDETLGIDDVFDVKVIGEQDLSMSYRIAMDGTIDFPYIGRLELAGLRPGEVQRLLTTKLRDGFLVAPQVTVMVKEWNSRRISVLGQVNKPGKVDYFPRMTIMDAIAAAGGFTPVAAQNSVKLRRDVKGRTEGGTFRVGDISEGRAPNVILLPRDVLFVDERMF
jgi:protein involved in polysaccharide export with SLBB domain